LWIYVSIGEERLKGNTAQIFIDVSIGLEGAQGEILDNCRYMFQLGKRELRRNTGKLFMFQLDRRELKGKYLKIVDLSFNWGRGGLRGNTALVYKCFH
jgi:hypothetical protein